MGRIRTSAWAARVLPAALLLAALLLSFLVVLYPPGRDQSAFVLCGRMWREGAALYRDCWDVKGPLMYVLAAWADAWTQGALWGLRVADVLAIWVSAGFLMALLPLAWRYRVAAVFLWVTLYVNLNYWNNTQAESFATPLVLAATWLLVATDREALPPAFRWATAVGAGGLIGLAALFKPTALIVGGVVVVLVHLGRGQVGGRTLRQVLVGSMFGVALVLGGAAWWLYRAGALRAYVDILLFLQGPYARHGTGTLLERGVNLLLANRWLLRNDHTLPALMAVVAMPHAWRDPRGRGLVAMLVGGWLSVHVQGHYWAYHWIYLLPPLAGLAIWGGAYVAREVEARAARAFWLFTLGVPLLFLPREVMPTLRAVWEAAPPAVYFAPFGEYGQGHFSLRGDWEVAQYVQERVAREEPILVWGSEPVIYLFAGREPATRFVYDMPLSLPDHPWRETWRRLFMADVRAHPPRAVIVATRDMTAVEARTSWEQLATFPEFNLWLQAHYELVGEVERFRIYMRREE